MMASHRPDDTPPPPPPETQPPPADSAVPGARTTLPASGFLVGFDWLLAFGVLVFAFLIASFAARNHDLWIHLAAGRLLANGDYQFGKDPFSYVGGDRAWVNHAWLFDWFLYQLYRVGAGPALVIAKAIALALTAGLLLVARRPGQSVFPGVVCTGLALLASAPRMFLQPTIATFLALAALMFLIIRVPRRPGSWSFPLLIAGLFWVWANCDQWFFLGPAFLFLYTAGQYLRPDEGEDAGSLWKALGLGVLACMLNPHHVRVWTLPPEAFDARLADLFAGDPEFGPIFRTGMDKEAWDFDANALNPTALIVLLALTVIGFVVNRRQASVGLGLVVLGAVGLAYLHLRALPFLAFVAAPVAAFNLAAAGGRLAQRPMPEGAVRTLHTVRTAGRGIVGLIGLLLIALTYAGWTHPFNQQRRWKWDVEPSQSMIRAAERIQKWRTEGTLPPEARLLNLQPDFANYVAWFAPAEKSFFDYRFAFHRPEAAEYVALRKYLTIRDARERQQSPYDLTGFLRKYNVTYAVSAHSSRILNTAAVEALWADDPQAGGPEWVLWHVDGRAVVLGWTKQEAIPPSDFDRLRFDPIRAAYAEATPLTKPDVRLPLPAQDIWERYVQGPPAPAPEGEEAHVLMRYRDSLVLRTALGHRMLLGVTYALVRGQLMMPGLTVWAWEMTRRVLPVMPPAGNATALLAVRAGRKAVATSPDHADGYYFLAKAYQESGYYLFPEIQETVTAVNFARCKARLPDDAATWRTTVDVLDLLQQLDRAHATATPRRLDLQLDVTRQSVDYLNHLIDQREVDLARLTGDEREQVDKEVDQLRKMVDMQARRHKDGKAELEKGTAKYINAAVGSLFVTPLNRAALARQFGLVQEAIKELRRAHDQFQKDLGEGKKFSSDDLALQLAMHAELIELLMFDGHVEEAAQILDSLDTPDTIALMDSPGVRQAYFSHRRQALAILFGGPQRAPISRYDTDPAGHFRSLRQAVALCVGDFQTAIDAQAADLRTVQRDYDNHRDLYFRDAPRPPGPLPDQFDLVLDQFYRPLLAPLNPVAAHLGGMARVLYTARADQLLQLSQARVENHIRLGLTHLEEGDVPSAARHFAESLKSPEFKDPLPVQRQAAEYLRAIERATGGRGTGP